MLWFLIPVAIFSGIVSIAEFVVMTNENSDGKPSQRTWKAIIWIWSAPCVMVLSIVGAVTFYHVQWTTRHTQEAAIMDARFGTENVVNVLDRGASTTYQGWWDVLVVLRGTPYDHTLKLRVNPSNGGVMKW